MTGSAPERFYQRPDFRTAYNRYRYIMDPV